MALVNDHFGKRFSLVNGEIVGRANESRTGATRSLCMLENVSAAKFTSSAVFYRSFGHIFFWVFRFLFPNDRTKLQKFRNKTL